MSDQAPHQFSTDRPIEGSAGDRLGRFAFGRSVAAAVAAWRERDSLVLGLTGAWGAGKTSVTNLIVEQLSTSSPSTRVIRFNPWSWSTQDHVLEAFFDTVATALDVPNASEQDRLAAKEWRRYSAVLQLGTEAAKGIGAALPAALGLVGALSMGLTTIDPRLGLVPAFLLALVASVNAVFPFVGKMIQGWTEFLEARAAATEGGLEDRKRTLATAMRALSGNVLIIIDDIDRLPPHQVLEVCQLIKVNADLPNVVYLLVFERNVVVAALKAASIPKPEQYLEKVIQVQFDVPAVTHERLDAMFFESLDGVLNAIRSIDKTFDRQRWARVYLGGIQPHLKSLRDVNRIVSALSLQIEALTIAGVLEVDFIDVVALEVLRHFEPDLYAAIRDSKTLLTQGLSHLTLASAKQKAATDALVAKGIHEESARELVADLFPLASAASSSGEHLDRDLRVGSPLHFDKYFTLSIPREEVTRGTIDALIESTDSLSELRTALDTVRQEGRLDALVARLEAYTGELPQENATTIATGIFDVGDALNDEPKGLFELDSEMHAIRVVYHFFKRLDPVNGSSSLLEAFKQTHGLSVPVSYLSLEFRRDEGEAERARGPATLQVSDRDVAKQVLLARIRAEATSGVLWGRPRRQLLNILYRWRDWTGSFDEPRGAIAAWLSTAQPVERLTFLRAFVGQTKSYTSGERIPAVSLRLESKALTHFLDHNTLGTIVQELLATTVADEDRRSLLGMQKLIDDWVRIEQMSDDQMPADEFIPNSVTETKS